MPFTFEETQLKDVILVRPRIFSDDRGFFLESYKEYDFRSAGITEKFVQDNHSYSEYGVLRGLHFQHSPHAQGKLVRVIEGVVWDVAVDIRPESDTYGKWVGVTLDSGEGTMLYIPPGFAHGFVVLSSSVHFFYKCTAEYDPGADSGIRWDDPDLAISWPLKKISGQPHISDKDRTLPFLKDLSS